MRRPWRGGPGITLAAAMILPLSRLLTRRRWSGQENIPASGGVILVANHLSTVDPPLLAHYVYAAGRNPRFMATSELWEVPILRHVLASAGQIPVYRRDPSAQDALRDAIAALRAGRAVVIYPEGGITTDPDYWPSRSRTGVARLVLATGAPVIPVAQWGAQQIWGKDRRLRLIRRPEIRIHAGRAVDLARFAERSRTLPGNGATGRGDAAGGEAAGVEAVDVEVVDGEATAGAAVSGEATAGAAVSGEATAGAAVSVGATGGAAVDGGADSARLLREVTDAVMADLLVELERLRGEPCPRRPGLDQVLPVQPDAPADAYPNPSRELAQPWDLAPGGGVGGDPAAPGERR
ncbi:1-acyl-sn-glycerol-3-phosphate acyltransferase [Frankia sp. CcI49]|uniref:lysophospholipid acyltransferase family protein n=1 Tax=Frankia sp. CcI49 TaxID=1745382 RepID=UPI0024119117|nr:1-acyl-sn-glycerol-3-phosphate acyltransferase [Frankia sp. CcI49]